MQMIQTGSHPGESSVVFMPMIDLKADDKKYIFNNAFYCWPSKKKAMLTQY